MRTKRHAALVAVVVVFAATATCAIARRRHSRASDFLSSIATQNAASSPNQCLARQHRFQPNQLDQVQVDAATNRRSFSAKVVGIFSCYDTDSSPSAAAAGLGANSAPPLNAAPQTGSNDLTLDMRLAKPSIDLAVAAVNAKYSNIHLNVTYRSAPDICKHQQAAGHAAEEYYVNGANYFVGPGCGESLASVGQLASYWNVPMCSTGYLPEMITARFKPLTLMQLSLSVQSVGEMLLELFQMYKWRHLVIVTDEKHPLHPLIRDGLLEFFHTMYMFASTGSSASAAGTRPLEMAMGAAGGQLPSLAGHSAPPQQTPQPTSNRPDYYINITSRNFDRSKSNDIDYDKVVLDAASYSRIMLLLARSSTIGKLLESAHRNNMSRGQFVFIAHELFETQQFAGSWQGGGAGGNAPPHKHQMGREIGEKIEIKLASAAIGAAATAKETSGGQVANEKPMREIFRPLMTISVRIPTTPEFGVFKQRVAALSEREFNYRLQPATPKTLYSLGVAACIYDCIMLYADIVDYVLRQTEFGKIDGKTIFALAANRTFTEALTGNLTLNLAGQRVIDFTLNDFSPKTLTLEPIAYFSAIDRKLKFLPGAATSWQLRNQSAPRSDPRCRLNESFCLLNGAAYYFDDGDDPRLWSGYLGAVGVGSDENGVMLSIWLVVALVLSVALTSSIIGWFVYRKFRIESELLNLWWSIKYEDILFEDDLALNLEGACDGKRSLSSLAISNESLTERGGGAAIVSTAINNMQLSVSHEPAPGQALSAAHSTSTLSVGGGSATGISTSATTGAGGPAGSAARAPLKLGKAGGPLAGRAAAQQSGSAKARGGGGGGSASNAAATSAAQNTGPNAKDPSISSQNKNVKLKLGTVLNSSRDSSHTTKVGLYKASRVAAKHLNVRQLNINRQLLIELRQVRDLTHENLIKFIGLCPEEPNVAIVSELCTRGNLQDLLQNDTIRLDWPFRFSIINDIVDGLTHLHSSPVQYHGRLKSSNCVIDNRFVVKLTDFGLPTLLAACEVNDDTIVNPRLLLWTAPEHLRTKHPLASGSQKGDIYSLAIIFQEIITRCGPFECEPILCGASGVAATADMGGAQQFAPLIRTTDTSVPGSGGAAQRRVGGRGTVGLARGSQLNLQHQPQQFQAQPPPQQLIQPVIVQHKQRLEPEEIVNLVRMGLSPPFRPYFRPDVFGGSVGVGASVSAGPLSHQQQAAAAAASRPDFNVGDLVAIVQSCWQEAPASRPTISSVKQQIKKMRRGCHLDGANLMDNLLQRMERYTDNLESLVEQKTAELMEEKKRSEELLYEMLPRFVVDQLKYGHSVTPEAYEAVTISFSDIKDFTSIAAQSSPIEVVNLLNQLYTEFDDCLARYDVYKVETIGDAYMVVSGLPVRNGDLHAKEIAEMSLGLLELIRNFDVAHLPHVNLELRIGIHSGPCASGVVGTRMFRYCLFGDTVNTASRMESHGEPMKIHISEDSANILARFGSFRIEPRGQVDIKGKGPMNTFWLEGRLNGNASGNHYNC